MRIRNQVSRYPHLAAGGLAFAIRP